MKKSGLIIFFFGSLILLLSNCARRGTPDGGPLDLDPPEYIRARPENFSTNFDANEIRIFFDEYVKITDPQRQIIISPPMEPRPEITPIGTASRSISINIDNELEPNTTYTINFGRSIIDNNEGNPLDFFTYAFSTGAYIDSLTVAGRIQDGLLPLPEPFTSVMLYEVDSTYTDSAVYTQMPRYITNTLDSSTTFQLKNLKEGTYQLVGLQDTNNNYLFDPEIDKIGFADEYITIPTESVFDLILFREEMDGKFTRPQQTSAQHLILGYTGVIDQDALEITPLSAPEGFTSRITQDAEKDTLHYWYKPALERDSLLLEVSTPTFQDTLVARIPPTEKKDSLTFSFMPGSSIGFAQPVRILPSVPLVTIDTTRLQLVNRDTLPVPFSSSYDEWNNEVILEFQKEENQTYNFIALPGAFEGFFGSENDTLRSTFKTRSYADYGNLTLNLAGVEEFPVIVQITSEDGEVIAEQYSTGETNINFRNVTPGKYNVRLIYDRNENRIFDTGRFLERRQPEEVIYFPDLLDIRPNWDVSQLFNVL